MITILLACFNGKEYLPAQLDSILSQTTKEPFSVLIRDDGSTDDSQQVLAQYADRYPDKITLLEGGTPTGSAKGNFFALLDAVREKNLCQPGDYLMFSDQDDVWLPDKVERTLALMRQTEKNPAVPALVHGNLKVVDKDLAVIHPSFFDFQGISPERCSLTNLLVQNCITGCTMMINQPLFALADKTPPVCAMHDWWLGLLAACFGKIGYTDQPLMLYRQHGDNSVGAKDIRDLSFYTHKLSQKEQIQKNYREMFAQAEFLCREYEDKLTSQQKEILTAWYTIPKLRRFGKARRIVKYGFTKNTWLRTLGQFFSI